MTRRILLLVTDLQIGGTPTVVRELALRLNRPPAVEIEVACLAPAGPVSRQLTDGGIVNTALNASSARDISAIGRLAGLIQGRRIDTVLSFLVHANAAAAAASLVSPPVRWIQSIQTTQPNPRWHWRVQGLAQRRAEKVVVPSPSAARCAREWAGVPEEKIVVIPNAVDLPAELSIRPAPWRRIGFLGRLDPIKRIGDLIDALPLIPDARLDIFGEGEMRAALQEHIRRLNLTERATLHGAVERPADALNQMDVLVLPSAAEGFGLVLIEAMAAGVPVVASDVDGIRDVIVPNRTGLLVPVANPTALAAAITRTLLDANLRDELVRQGRAAVAERFSWPAVLPRYRELLQI